MTRSWKRFRGMGSKEAAREGRLQMTKEIHRKSRQDLQYSVGFLQFQRFVIELHT
jgi:hypothetical protein